MGIGTGHVVKFHYEDGVAVIDSIDRVSFSHDDEYVAPSPDVKASGQATGIYEGAVTHFYAAGDEPAHPIDTVLQTAADAFVERLTSEGAPTPEPPAQGGPYLLMEDGGRIMLEDGSGFLLLE